VFTAEGPIDQGRPFADAGVRRGGSSDEDSMTDGTISAVVSLVVGMLATSVAAVVVSRTRERGRRAAADHETLALRDARLRAELHLLEVQAGELRTQVDDLQRQREELVAMVEAARPWSDPSAAIAEGALRRARAHPHDELSRRLEAAAGARLIPFPFLADTDE
jgi:hypothetical protein